MKLSDFETLELAQVYSVTVDTKRVGSGQARAFFTEKTCDANGPYADTNLWTLFNIAAADVNHALFAQASSIVITASDGSSYFGMDSEKSDGVGNRLRIQGMVDAQIITQTDADDFISKTLSTTYPFKNTTQEELDAAKSEAALYIDTPPVLIGHPHLDSGEDYTVVLSNKSVQFAVILDAPAVVDTKIDIFVHTDYSDTNTFETKGLKVGYILVKSGDTNGSIKINKSLSRKIQASAVSNVACNYNMIVKAL